MLNFFPLFVYFFFSFIHFLYIFEKGKSWKWKCCTGIWCCKRGWCVGFGYMLVMAMGAYEEHRRIARQKCDAIIVRTLQQNVVNAFVVWNWPWVGNCVWLLHVYYFFFYYFRFSFFIYSSSFFLGLLQLREGVVLFGV